MQQEGEEEDDIIIHNGKKYRIVQIEGEEEECLLDEEQNIYNRNFQLLGQANLSDADDD